MADSTFPNTGSTIQTGLPASGEENTSSSLSTQILIKVNGEFVGALQTLSVSQTRPLKRVTEIGTDGVIEIVPSAATTYDLTVGRIVFDQLRLPEAFSRAFRFIAAQRVPFDIEIFDVNNSDSTSSSSGTGVVVMTYANCWFTNYATPYTTTDYLITETASIMAETAYVSKAPGDNFGSMRDIGTQTDTNAGIPSVESNVNSGLGRGAMDAFGIVNAVF